MDDIEIFNAPYMVETGGICWDAYTLEVHIRDIVHIYDACTSGDKHTFPRQSVERSVTDTMCWRGHHTCSHRNAPLKH